MLDRLVEIAKAAGAFDYRLQDYTDENGVYRTPAWHLLGTCRMGETPTCRWSTSGTSAGTCRTSTSSTAACSRPAAWSTRPPPSRALALRAAEHLRDNFRELRRATRPVLDA